jgi:hypothetical protein
MIDRFERFSMAISEISRHWHKIAAEELEKYGLKGPHAIYLPAMYQHQDGITAARLADLCGRDKADVSRMMTIMEQKGLVLRDGANKKGVKDSSVIGCSACINNSDCICQGIQRLTHFGKSIIKSN